MKRRDFLQAGAVVLAGANAVSAGENESPGKDGRKGVLITCAEGRLAGAIAKRLTKSRDVRLTSTVDVRSDHPFVRSDLDHTQATDKLVRGLEAIVHLARPPAGANDEERIDYCTRQTYNLLFAAKAQGVRKIVLLSSLDAFTDYDDDFEVDEDWRPLPSTDAVSLPNHLAEFTCREFAREKTLTVVVLRLGHVVRAEDVAGKPYDSMWVDERDVAQAVEGALSVEFRDHPSGIRSWGVFHVQSDSRAARFMSNRAKGGLGYAPEHFGDR